jgi:diacylglycerol kinase (ATP)
MPKPPVGKGSPPRTNDSLLVILNPVSGSGRSRPLWPQLEPSLRERFPELCLEETSGPGDATRRAAAWTAGGGSAVLVIGGDGTVHEAVNGLLSAGRPIPLGVIPAGTGNDFARNAGIPLDPLQAAGVSGAAPPRLLDLGRVEYQAPDQELRTVWFVNSLSAGVSPDANARAGRIRRWLPGRLGYQIGGLVALLAGGSPKVRGSGAGGPLHARPALNLTLANGACFGGGIPISPRSSPWDGMLERVIIGPLGRPRALLAFAALQRGRHLGLEGIEATTTSEPTTIRSDSGAPFHFEADGHDYPAAGPLTVTVEPARLPVWAGP